MIKSYYHYVKIINSLDIGDSKKSALRGACKRLYDRGIVPDIVKLSTESRIALKRIR
jgi:hypothetical protein